MGSLSATTSMETDSALQLSEYIAADRNYIYLAKNTPTHSTLFKIGTGNLHTIPGNFFPSALLVSNKKIDYIFIYLGKVYLLKRHQYSSPVILSPACINMRLYILVSSSDNSQPYHMNLLVYRSHDLALIQTISLREYYPLPTTSSLLTTDGLYLYLLSRQQSPQNDNNNDKQEEKKNYIEDIILNIYSVESNVDPLFLQEITQPRMEEEISSIKKVKSVQLEVPRNNPFSHLMEKNSLLLSCYTNGEVFSIILPPGSHQSTEVGFSFHILVLPCSITFDSIC